VPPSPYLHAAAVGGISTRCINAAALLESVVQIVVAPLFRRNYSRAAVLQQLLLA